MAKKLISLANLTRFKNYLNLAFEDVSEALAEKPDEAPDDGKQYARQSGAWSEVKGGQQRVFVQENEPQDAPSGSIWIKVPPKVFVVTGGAMVGGTVYVGTSPNPATTSCEVTSGQTVYVRCVASSGYSFSSWTSTGGTRTGTGSATGGTIKNISSNITVSASFERASSTVTSYLLSKGYQTCEYIQSSGSQYINTGLVINANDLRIKTTLTPTQLGNSSYNYEAGGAYGNNTRSMSIQMGYRTAYSGLGNADKQLSPSYSVSANTEYEIDWHASNGQFTGTINGTNVSVTYSGSLASNQAYYLFAENSSGRAQNQGRFKMGRTEMWLSGDQERDLIPCYNVQTNAGYMWDKLHDVFYPNAGSGSFTIGPNITIDEEY